MSRELVANTAKDRTMDLENLFLYFYRITDDYKPMWDKIGHIKLPDDQIIIFLCGLKKFANGYVVYQDARSSRKICKECLKERDRLVTGRPTSQQVKTWFQDGMVEYRNERKALKGRR